ncbi:hypothetical protein [Polymorphobacter megasporae]|uniref:hypothetical protein n=1 Tax=Glacieibacterium megasporae TaxID=2835787 RepID=UPI001C1E50EA|nr:hypothetical protein [Polymorphobacter megasporae]UAJ09155.1 hypothetical protein KTC28_12465 [Polymorphobacter megasporae]
MIYAVALALASAGNASPVTQIETLHCGAVEYRMASGASPGEAAPLAPAFQTLIRRAGVKQDHGQLERGPSVVIRGHRVLARYVSSWACLTGHHQTHYALLAYACSVEPGAEHDCGGEKEWFRLLDTRGRFVDPGVPHDGPQRERLYARLGITAAMAGGVKMTPVVR